MNYKILIADDDTELVKMLRTFFELRNYTVITASDGAETLKMIERKPDIILLDIKEELEEHPFSWYFSRKFADFAGLFMGFTATILLAVLFMQDMRKNTYELLHTKPISATQYIIGKVAGGFLICLVILGILNLVFWAACMICTSGNGFEIRLTDFLLATCQYILPNISLMGQVTMSASNHQFLIAHF